MKVSLVVAQGVHEGKVIPIPVAQFLIGREEGCQLRPSSPAISKKHCGLLVKGGKVFVQDFGSTNGTFLNDQQITGEVEVKNGDKLRAGPLDFVVKVEPTATPSRNQPRPKLKPSSAELPTPAPKEAPTKEEPAVARQPAAEEPDADQIAAMLLGTDDGPAGPITADQIPDGSTVFDMTSMNPGEKKPDEKKPPTAEQDNSKRRRHPPQIHAAAAIVVSHFGEPGA